MNLKNRRDRFLTLSFVAGFGLWLSTQALASAMVHFFASKR